LYTIHGYSNGHDIPLVFALLVSKSEDTYRQFLQHVIDICSARNLPFKPAVVHVELEITVHNVFRQRFPETSIQCCHFHLRQSWWRKIQKTGLSTEYKDNESSTGKCLKSFFGLAFLDPSDVEDCFGDDIMRVLPEDPRCTSFADYILENYIVLDSRFPPHCGLHYRHSTQYAQLMERSRSMHTTLTTTNNFMQLIPQYLFS
jgi:hypothetical protein